MLMKSVCCEESSNLESVKDHRHFGQPIGEPLGKQPDIFDPIIEGQLFEGTGTLPDAPIIIPKHLDLLTRQVSRPAHPRVIREVAFRGKRTNKQKPRNRFLHLVQNRVEVRPGNFKVSDSF